MPLIHRGMRRADTVNCADLLKSSFLLCSSPFRQGFQVFFKCYCRPVPAQSPCSCCVPGVTLRDIRARTAPSLAGPRGWVAGLGGKSGSSMRSTACAKHRRGRTARGFRSGGNASFFLCSSGQARAAPHLRGFGGMTLPYRSHFRPPTQVPK